MSKSFRLIGVNKNWREHTGNRSTRLKQLTIGKFYTKTEDSGLDFRDDNDKLCMWDAYSWEGLEDAIFTACDQHIEETFTPLVSKTGPVDASAFDDMSAVKEPEVPGGTKHDQGKVMMGLLVADCAASVEDIAKVLSFGARKYAPRGWKVVDPYRYLDAMHRHLSAHYLGEKFDEESGLSHLSHAACNLVFLMEIERTGKCMFDRPL